MSKDYCIGVDGQGCLLFLDAEDDAFWILDREQSEELAKLVLDKDQWQRTFKAQMKRLHNA